MNRIRGYLLGLVLLVAAPLVVLGQNYVPLADASGFDRSDFEVELEAATQELISVFPSELQAQFKVFDFGFYLHNETQSGGVEEAFNKGKSFAAAASPYYLLFAKETNQDGVYSKFWIDLVLPTTGQFECLDLISATLRNSLLTKYELQANSLNKDNGYNPFKFSDIEINVINDLKDFIVGLFDCCDPTGFKQSGDQCTACIYGADDLISIQKNDLFLLNVVQILHDPEWQDPLITFRRKDDSEKKNNFDDVNVQVRFLDGTDSDLDAYVELFKNEQLTDFQNRLGVSADISFHKYKYPRDCGLYDQKWIDYQQDPSEYKAFLSIINKDNNIGVLGYHSTVSDLSSNILSFNSTESEDEIRADEIADIEDVEDESGRPCNELAKSVAALYGAAQVQAHNYHLGIPDEVREANSELYESASANYSEARAEMSIYWSKEYVAVFTDYDTSEECWAFCGVRAGWRTTDNLCNKLIHIVLDACELIPVVGTVCAAANTILYLSEDEYGKAALSAAALIPVVGNVGGKTIKYGGKLWKPLVGGCIGGSSLKSAAPNYCRLFTWTIKYISEGNQTRLIIKFARNGGQLRRTYVRNGLKNVFNGIEIAYDGAIRNAHHLIPWELCQPNSKQHRLMKKLAGRGWHPNNPTQNGFIIPKNLPNGNTFHGSHANYNNWMQDALGKLDGVPDDELLETTMAFRDFLKNKIQDAYVTNNSLHNYFANLKDFDLLDLL